MLPINRIGRCKWLYWFLELSSLSQKRLDITCQVRYWGRITEVAQKTNWALVFSSDTDILDKTFKNKTFHWVTDSLISSRLKLTMFSQHHADYFWNSDTNWDNLYIHGKVKIWKNCVWSFQHSTSMFLIILMSLEIHLYSL